MEIYRHSRRRRRSFGRNSITTVGLRAQLTDDVDDNATRIWTVGGNYYIKSHDIKLQGDYLLSDREAGDELEGRFIGRVQVIF